jgi:polysaccharide export outer membrane protein
VSFVGKIACYMLAATLAGCSALPASGPTAEDFSNQEASNQDLGGYVLIDVNERVTSIFAAQPRPTLLSLPAYHPAPDLRIGVGDVVAVTIWEAAAGGLFSAGVNDRSINAGSRTATLPGQIVARDGSIGVPYAGRLKAAGLTPAQLETEIVNRLQGKAIEPQAIVTILKNNSNTATVTGEVTAGARVPLDVKGDRILDVIATAGGIRAPAHDSIVELTRGGRTISVPFNTIVSNPKENIYVRPNDTITVIKSPQTFSAFGSTGRNATVPFDAAGISLDEAIARAGGLLDYRADPAGIFLLRFEPRKLVEELAPGRSMPSDGNLIPVVYKLNLRDANSFFLARAFQMKDKDILYVANSPSDPVQKFLGLVGTITSPVISGVGVYGTLKN